MDNAVALTSPQPVVVQNGFAERMAAMPMKAKLSLAVGIVALIGVLLAMVITSGQGDFKVLYANLSDKDGGAVVAQLSQMNVPYKLNGGTILVPAGQVPDLRLKMATAGLPKGSVFGYELMDSARFGQTQFQERLTFQRGLEGELTRSITSLAAVENARVHLALPNQNGFFREQQKPSASVLLSLNAGRTLDRAQIAGIVHLVSSSVPELDPKAVSVLDQSGALLTHNDDKQNGLDAQQLQYVGQIETGLSKRIFDLLEPIVGRDNLRASVAADVDFSQTEATSEEYRPNQGADASISIRSQQTNDASAGGAGAQAAGVPGAATNQPPLAATAPLTGASQPLQAAPVGGAGGAGSGQRAALVNYELDKTVRMTKNATGVVKRLNAAVVVNNRSVTDAKGKTTQVPLSTDEIEKLTTLVRESIGFKQDRGDSVKVINAPFKIEKIEPVSVPFWKQPDTLDIVRVVALPGALAFVALLIFIGLIRPAMKAMQAAATRKEKVGQILDAIEDEPTPLPLPKLPTAQPSVQLEEARQMARTNPAAVAGILRTWVEGEAGPTIARA